MSKKPSASLPTFSDKQLRPLHQSLLAFTGQSHSWEQESERARERAFQVRTTPALFKYWYLRSQVLKRFQEGVVPASVRREAALAKFHELEAVAQRTNERLFDGWNKPWPADIRSVLLRARRIIGDVLGPFDLDALPVACGFSSGATTEQTRDRAAASIKWEEATHVTADAMPYAIAFCRWAGFNQPFQWYDAVSNVHYVANKRGPCQFEVVDGNEVFTVPKRFDIDRTCAKEPPWNVFLQKGCGTLIRRAVNRVGLLHPDAQELHARLAREASHDNMNATVDMKGASELVVLCLVMLLVPPDWVRVLLDLRSPVGSVPGHGPVTYHKISSMGNGYTFELETLLFWAIAKACCKEEEVVSVYGDDLICPATRMGLISRVFKHVGFEFNSEKSFTEGPFRESCGGHYWKGVDVKPFYVERLPRSLAQIIGLHNDIITWLGDGPKYQRLITIAKECRKLVPRQFWGPAGTAGSLWCEWDEARPRFVTSGGRPKQPSYNHWRISTVRREVLVQRHEYLRGSLLATYWDQLQKEPRDHPWFRSRMSNRLLALALHEQERRAMSRADFTFALTREVRGWQAVGVASDWPRLPVRIA